jgi:hypothetical protein
MLAQAIGGQEMAPHGVLNACQQDILWAPVTAAEGKGIGPKPIPTPGCHYGHVLDAMPLDIGQLIALAPGGGSGWSRFSVQTS